MTVILPTGKIAAAWTVDHESWCGGGRCDGVCGALTGSMRRLLICGRGGGRHPYRDKIRARIVLLAARE